MRYLPLITTFCLMATSAFAEPSTEKEIAYQPPETVYDIPSQITNAMTVRGIQVGMSLPDVEKVLSELGGFKPTGVSTTTADWRASKVLQERRDNELFQVFFPKYKDRIQVHAFREHFNEQFTLYFLPDASGGNLYALEWKIWTGETPLDGADLISTMLTRIGGAAEDTVSETNFRGPYREFRWSYGRDGTAAAPQECESQYGRLKDPNSISAPIFVYGVGYIDELTGLNISRTNCLNVVYLDVVGHDSQIIEANVKFSSISMMSQGLVNDFVHASAEIDNLAKSYSEWKSGAKAPTP